MRYLNRLLSRGGLTETASVRSCSSLDFETDSLRFLFEVSLAEYESTRHQIEVQLQLAERSIDYLLTLVAALFVLVQVLAQGFSQITDTLNRIPFVYLVTASIFLWFPMQHLITNAHIAFLAKYEVDVLAPKLNAIATRLSAQSSATQEFLEWEAETFPSWLRGVLRWEGFRAQGEMRRSALLFGAVDALRYVFLTAPSFMLVISFVSTKGSVWTGWTPLERSMGVVFAVVLIILLIGLVALVRSYIGLVPARQN